MACPASLGTPGFCSLMPLGHMRKIPGSGAEPREQHAPTDWEKNRMMNIEVNSQRPHMSPRRLARGEMIGGHDDEVAGDRSAHTTYPRPGTHRCRIRLSLARCRGLIPARKRRPLATRASRPIWPARHRSAAQGCACRIQPALGRLKTAIIRASRGIIFEHHTLSHTACRIKILVKKTRCYTFAVQRPQRFCFCSILRVNWARAGTDTVPPSQETT